MPPSNLHRQSFSTFRYEAPYGVNPDGAAPVTSHYGPEPFFRDGLDARRTMYAQTPEAQYPDGYLGTINSRRGDRLLDALKQREGTRPYQRGVHKGERISPQDYFWSEAMDPEMGLARQSKSQFNPETGTWLSPRAVPTGRPSEHLTAEGKLAPRGSADVITINPARAARLAHLRPGWS